MLSRPKPFPIPIDCDIVCGDMLVNEAVVEDKRLMIHKEGFDLLIIPFAEYLPGSLLASLEKLARQGLPLVFINDLPQRSDDRAEWNSWMTAVKELDHVQTVALDDLARFMRASGYYELETSDYQPWLRAYHYKQNDGDLFLFFNESPSEDINTEIRLPRGPFYYSYDAMENRSFSLAKEDTQGRISLTLVPGELTVLFTSEIDLGQSNQILQLLSAPSSFKETLLTGPWEVAHSAKPGSSDYVDFREMAELADMSLPGYLPEFAGTIRYRSRFNRDNGELSGKTMLDLGDVFETAEIRLNGKTAGVKIAPPYRFDVSDYLRERENELEVFVTTTLVRTHPDRFSLGVAQDPMGLVGPVAASSLRVKG